MVSSKKEEPKKETTTKAVPKRVQDNAFTQTFSTFDSNSIISNEEHIKTLTSSVIVGF